MDTLGIRESCEASGTSSVSMSDGFNARASMELGSHNPSRQKLKRTASSEMLDARQAPSRSKPPWSPLEESTLAMRHAQLGNRWAAIAKYLNGRTENDVKNMWHSTLRAKSCRRSSLLYTYTRAVRECCDDPQARRVAYDRAQQLCLGEGTGASASPQMAAAAPVTTALQQPGGAAARSGTGMAPLDSEQMLGSMISPWRTGSGLDMLGAAAVGPQHMTAEPHPEASSSVGVWAREYSAASIARVPGGMLLGGGGGGSGGAGVVGRLGSTVGGGGSGFAAGPPPVDGCGASQSQPHSHVAMRTVLVQPGRPLSSGVDHVTGVTSALGGHHLSASLAVAAGGCDLTGGAHSTLSSNSSTCVARLAQLVLSSESHTQHQQHLHLHLQHQQHSQHQQQLLLPSGTGEGIGLGGASPADCHVGARSDLGGAAGLMRYGNFQLPSMPGAGAHVNQQQRTAQAFAAAAASSTSASVMHGGAALSSLSVGRAGLGSALVEPPRGPFRTCSEAAALSLGLERRSGVSGGVTAETAMRQDIGLLGSGRLTVGGGSFHGGSGGGIIGGDGGGSVVLGALEEELGLGGGSSSTPPTVVGPFVVSDAAFSGVRQTQQLRSHDFLTNAMGSSFEAQSQQGEQSPHDHLAAAAAAAVFTGGSRGGGDSGDAPAVPGLPATGGVRGEAHVNLEEGAGQPRRSHDAIEGAGDPRDSQGSRGGLGGSVQQEGGGLNRPMANGESPLPAEELKGLATGRTQQPSGLELPGTAVGANSAAAAVALHQRVAIGRDAGGGGFHDGGGCAPVIGRPAQGASGRGGTPRGDQRLGAQVTLGAAAAAGMGSLQQPTATDAVVVMGLADDDILACLGGMRGMDTGSRRNTLPGYGSRGQQGA